MNKTDDRQIRIVVGVLVVVGTQQPAETRPELVLGLDVDENEAPIDFAFQTAATLGLSIRVVRAFEPESSYDGCYVDDVEVGRGDALIGMGNLLKVVEHEYPEVPVSFAATCGNAVPVLISAGHGARMIVVGSRRRHRRLSTGPGSTVDGLLSHPGTPVAVVPAR